MVRRPARPIFLERSSYRQRRIRDAARALPVLGMILLMVPLLWPGAEAAPGAAMPNAGALLYLLAVWAGLVAAAALLARPLQRDDDGQRDD